MSPSEILDHYRRKQQRATLLAVASLCLSIGLMTGFYLAGRRSSSVVSAHDLPSELASSFVEIARQVEPSVVNISTVTQPTGRHNPPDNLFLSDPSETERVRRGNGSGVIIDGSGFILTNHHVIRGVDRIKVKLFDGAEYAAQWIGSDPETDLAVIKIEPKTTLKPARVGDSERTRVGDWVLAIGSPFGLDQTVTAGIISARDREATEIRNRPSYQHFLQTDAAINRGNSGGPLINLSGEVIGINTAIATTTGDYNGIGFALPSTEAMAIYRQLNRQGRVVRGFLGVITDPVTPQIARIYGLPATRGAIVSSVNETYELDGREIPTPAAHAGLQLGDVLLEYRGEMLRSNLDLIRRVAATPVGLEVDLTVWRQGQELKLRTLIGRRPSGVAAPSQEPSLVYQGANTPLTLGLEVSGIPSAQARQLALNGLRGVIVSKVEPGSVAEDAELREDDLIETVNRTPVSTTFQFRRMLERLASGDPVVLQVYRRKAQVPRRFVSFNIP